MFEIDPYDEACAFFFVTQGPGQRKMLFACGVALPVTNEHVKPGYTMQGHRDTGQENAESYYNSCLYMWV